MLGSRTIALTEIIGKRTGIVTPDIHVAFGVDSKYVPAVAACMRSIITNNKDLRIEFHVITTSLPQNDVEHLAAFSERNAITLQVHILGPETVSKVPVPISPRFSSAIYNRLLICKLLEGITTHVLYLDADIICLGSIVEITRIQMDGKIVAAVA